MVQCQMCRSKQEKGQSTEENDWQWNAYTREGYRKPRNEDDRIRKEVLKAIQWGNAGKTPNSS